MKAGLKGGRPQSMRDRNLPFTYEGWVDILAGEGAEPVYDHFFSDTLCGLIECLSGRNISPGQVLLYGVYRGDQLLLKNSVLIDQEGNWLQRPALCRALEEHYQHTYEECFRGHVEQGNCSFYDRDPESLGPVW